jgi:hypothetical protein
LFLAQSAVNTMADLKTAVGHGLEIIVIISYVYAVILIIMACVQERGDRRDVPLCDQCGNSTSDLVSDVAGMDLWNLSGIRSADRRSNGCRTPSLVCNLYGAPGRCGSSLRFA